MFFSNVIYGHQRNQIKNWRRQWSQVTYSNTTMPQEITTVIDKWKQTLGQPRKTGTLIDINRSLPLFFKDGVEQKPNQKAFNDFLKGYFNGVDQTDDYVNFLANNAGQKMQRLLIMILSGKLCLNVNGDSRQVNVGATTFCVEWHFNNNKELYCYVKLNVVSILDTKTYYEMDIKGHIFEKEIEIMTPGKYEKNGIKHKPIINTSEAKIEFGFDSSELVTKVSQLKFKFYSEQISLKTQEEALEETTVKSFT